ncbi:hypothetical protein CBL_12700 [Carabus blaptoides fortunei]
MIVKLLFKPEVPGDESIILGDGWRKTEVRNVWIDEKKLGPVNIDLLEPGNEPPKPEMCARSKPEPTEDNDQLSNQMVHAQLVSMGLWIEQDSRMKKDEEKQRHGKLVQREWNQKNVDKIRGELS